MLHKELPTQIKPEMLCKNAPAQGTCISGKILLGQLPNLPEEFKGQEQTPLFVTLTFNQDSEGHPYIEGGLSVELTRNCQRCLQPMLQRIESPICVSPVANYNDAALLPPQYEPLLVKKGTISVAEWIAEELYLALPFVPRHDKECVGYDTNNGGQ